MTIILALILAQSVMQGVHDDGQRIKMFKEKCAQGSYSYVGVYPFRTLNMRCNKWR